MRSPRLVTALFLGAWISPQPAPSDSAFVRVVNAVPGQASIQMRLGSAGKGQAVSYGEVTAFLPAAGSAPVLWVADAQGRSATRDLTVQPGERYTAVAMAKPDGSGPEVRVFRDDFTTPAGKVKIKIIHAVRGASALEASLAQGAPIFERLSYGSDPGYRTIEPGTKAVRLRYGPGATETMTTSPLVFVAGRAYALVVTGKPGAVDVITFDDGPADAATN